MNTNINDSFAIYKTAMATRGKADNTVSQYFCGLKKFAQANALETVSDIKPLAVTKYREQLLADQLGATSINLYLAGLRSYFSFLYEHEYLDKDYSKLQDCQNYSAKKTRAIRGANQNDDPDDAPGQSIGKEERAMLVKAALENKNKIKGLNSTLGERNALMVRINFVCGMRVSDLVKLKVKDFKFDAEKQDWVLAYDAKKTGRRVSFFVCSESIMSDLEAYIKHNGFAETDHLFPSGKGGPMNTLQFWTIFKGIQETAGLSGFAPHDIRRTMATELYRSGKVLLKEISNRLGHADTSMTEKYLRINADTTDIANTRKSLAIFK